MIYNIKQIGTNAILFDYDIPDNQFVLAVFRVPCYSGRSNQSKVSILSYGECDNAQLILFTGVDQVYEDLTDGLIYYQNIGTWEADLYYQDNNTNLDPELATFIDTIQLQVNYG